MGERDGEIIKGRVRQIKREREMARVAERERDRKRSRCEKEMAHKRE